MSDTFTTTSSQSWFSRIGDAIKGILFGVVLAVLAVVLLSWNEKRAVKTACALEEGAAAVVPADATSVSPTTEGKLVHLSGVAKADGTLADEAFGITAPGALRLVRKVEMFQWSEKTESRTEKSLGGGTTTTKTTSYSKNWSESPIDSSRFASPADHANPGRFPLESKSTRAATVNLGAHTLNDTQVAEIPATKTLTPPAGTTPVAGLPKVTLVGASAVIGKDPASPAVGDLRVSFTCAEATDVSVVAAQKGASFTPYTTSNGREIDLLKAGQFTAAQMFQQAEASNSHLTWILRGVGFVVMGIGFSLLLRLLSVIGDLVPFIGDLIGAGTAFVAFAAAGACSLVTIAVAWIAVRPVVGITLIVAACGFGYAIHQRRSAKKAAAQPLQVEGA